MVDTLRTQSITTIWTAATTTATATSETISSATRHSMKRYLLVQMPTTMRQVRHLVCLKVVAMAWNKLTSSISGQIRTSLSKYRRRKRRLEGMIATLRSESKVRTAPCKSTTLSSSTKRALRIKAIHNRCTTHRSGCSTQAAPTQA